MADIAENIARIRRKIEDCARSSGRDPNSIKLVAVSKKKPPELIREAYAAGQRAFGENYAQDMQRKASMLADLDIEWHFIGHLQKNKAKFVAPHAGIVETIDSRELADILDRRAEAELNCLIEVNIGDEKSKSGVLPDDAVGLASYIMALPKLKLLGLMAMPPYDPDPAASRPYFRRLRHLLEDLNKALKGKEPLSELSMGMSHDFEVAIEEGATIVRIGTAIFGERI